MMRLVAKASEHAAQSHLSLRHGRLPADEHDGKALLLPAVRIRAYPARLPA